jgi:hypothetical protein
METPREFADRIWKTKGMDENNLQEFTIPLSTAIGMIETYCKKKDEAISKALDTFQNYWKDGQFYGAGIHVAVDLLKEAQTEKC